MDWEPDMKILGREEGEELARRQQELRATYGLTDLNNTAITLDTLREYVAACPTPPAADTDAWQVVYVLTEPGRWPVRYVGISRRPISRFQEHLSGKGANPDKNAWIAALTARGTSPEMAQVDVLEADILGTEARELSWLALFRRIGASMLLLNNEGLAGIYMRFPAGYSIAQRSDGMWYGLRPDMSVGPDCNSRFGAINWAWIDQGQARDPDAS
jgi:hypothetical protein